MTDDGRSRHLGVTLSTSATSRLDSAARRSRSSDSARQLETTSPQPIEAQTTHLAGAAQKTLEQDSDELRHHESHTDELSYQFLTFKTQIAIQPVWPNNTVPESAPKVPDYHQYGDPLEWSLTRKRLLTYLACTSNALAAYASGSYASPTDTLTQKWQISKVTFNFGIFIFTAGFGIAPMVLAPFSEINGRRPVFIGSGLLFLVSLLGCALTDTFGGMLAARFFLGVGCSTFSTMVGGVLADIWISAERNTPMVQFTGATLFGTGLGPLVSGVVAQRLLWRWVFYIQLILAGVFVSLVVIFFKETRGSVLLSRRAKTMNKYYEALEAAGAVGVVIPQAEAALIATDASTPPKPTNEHVKPEAVSSSTTNKIVRLRYRVKSDEERASLIKMISLSLYRPMHMLVTEPVVFWFTLWITFAWSVLYLQFPSIPLVFRVSYNFELEQTGFVFTSMCIAAIISTILSIYQEKLGMRYYPQKVGGSPEGRLFFTCVESTLLPIGLFMFGWTCFPSVHWIVPTIAVGFITMGIFAIFLAVFNYSADVYRIYASSAIAAAGLVRNVVAGVFPLVTNQMFTNLGFQAAGSLLGGIAAGLSLVPIALVFFGPRIRARSRIAVQFLEEDEKLKAGDAPEKDEEDGSADGSKENVNDAKQ